MIEFTVTPGRNDIRSNIFPSVTEALSHLPGDPGIPVTVRVMPGIYREKITLDRPNVRLIGSSAEDCILTYDDFANDVMPDGSKRGTFRSYTMLVDADNITLENLTVSNSASPRSKAGQAIALYADGDRLTVTGCRLTGFQDTLFTGPLPPAPMQPGGFTGPKEFAERRMTRQYYKDCYICGDVDFIFGSAIAYFETCEIASVFSEELPLTPGGSAPVYGYATAASTPDGSPYGYVFDRCRFTSTCPKNSVYLGRPWRDYAQTVLLNCFLGEHVRPEGFHDWNKENARKNCFYAEYKSYGPGAAADPAARADFVRALSNEDILRYSRENVLGLP